MHRDFKGIWISKDIWMLKDLSPTDKVFLAEVDSLDQGAGCYASLSHFAEMFNLSKSTCSERLTRLHEKGYIDVSFNEEQRKVRRLAPVFGKPNGGSENRTGGSENRNAIYKDREIHIEIHNYIKGEKKNFDECIDILNKQLNIESAARLSGFSIEQVKDLIPVFVKDNAGVEKVHNNRTDYLSHFRFWVAKQPVPKVDVSNELKWFVEKFNEVSGREFVATKIIRNLFVVQLSEGFTGKQMKRAIRNLYHPKNKWHSKTNYEHATPEFLLKGDNLNKILNLKF